MNSKYSRLLSQIEKPLRYINHEINAVHKDFEKAKSRFCFIYPDIYEIGISHLGIKILYTIINKENNSMADRAYAPWPDLGDKLLKEKIALTSLESQRDLKDFDCLCFTLQTELIYTNILYVLELSQIPLRRTDRKDNDPVIIAGGINAVNPHPLSLFIDAFFIGEAEDGIKVINDIFLTYTNRDERLKKLSELDYVYVSEYSGDKLVKALKYNNFSSSDETHFPQIVPLLEGTHNRYTSEIMRGCSRGCRFCQAGMFYRPVREKNPDILIEQLISDVANSGWDQASLMSLSSSDYSCIKPLLINLIDKLKGSGASLSLPSLRVDNLDLNLAELLNHIKKTGITLAPEAGTQILRDRINKNLTEEDILSAIEFAERAGAKLVKLYFMIGLPFETDEDIQGIIDLVEKIIKLTNKKMRINISVSPFVPKPFTPLQWARMDTEQVVLSKALKIKHSLMKYKFIKTSYHTVELSFLEAVLCRGDEKTAFVIEEAYKNGARFDGWREYFNYEIWKNAAESINYEWYEPINGFETNSKLPWDNISIGVDKQFLINEFNKAKNVETTPDCKYNAQNCTICGACNNNVKISLADSSHIPGIDKADSDNLESSVAKLNTESNYLYRIFFSKLNDLKFFSHLDFLRLVHRFLMLSDLKITFSQGFNPHPKTAFCPPLSSGVEGENEFFDVWTSEFYSEEEILKQLTRFKVRDLNFKQALLFFSEKKYSDKYLPVSAFDVESLEIHFLNDLDVEEMLKRYWEKEDFLIKKMKKDKEKIIDLNEIILSIEVIDFGVLSIYKKISGASVFDILKHIFNIDRDLAGELKIVRKDLLADT